VKKSENNIRVFFILKNEYLNISGQIDDDVFSDEKITYFMRLLPGLTGTVVCRGQNMRQPALRI